MLHARHDPLIFNLGHTFDKYIFYFEQIHWTPTLEKVFKVSIPKSLISFNPVLMVMMTSRVSKSAFSKGKINCHGLFSKRSDCSSLCKTKLTHFHQKFPNNSYSVKFNVLQTFLYLIYHEVTNLAMSYILRKRP